MSLQPDVGSIVDVPGIHVGQVTRAGEGWLTGVTVVIPDAGTVGGVDVRGGGPGTHETDALDPRTLVPTVDGVALVGGSAYGLSAAHGVQRWLAERDRGFRVGEAHGEVVPIVPAAAVFDLGRGGVFTNTPDAAMGYQAAASASHGAHSAVARGTVGAGTGAALGRRFKGGVGTASVRLSGAYEVVVGAIAVVNAAGLPWPRPVELEALLSEPAPDVPAATPPLNTTIAVVATNAMLDPAETSRTATAAHAGLARAIDPVHTLSDGDTVFALATQRVRLAPDAAGRVPLLMELQAAGAEALRLAVLDGIRSATGVTTTAIDLPRYPFADQLPF